MLVEQQCANLKSYQDAFRSDDRVREGPGSNGTERGRYLLIGQCGDCLRLPLEHKDLQQVVRGARAYLDAVYGLISHGDLNTV